MNVIRTTCCIIGGGPAGMMLGYLLARAGIGVVVLEKHADFFRDFRGDTVHPSTLDVLDELGLGEQMLALSPRREEQLYFRVDGKTLSGPDFRHISARHKFIVFVPQWDFLNLLATQARRYPSFRLMMEAEACDLVRTHGDVVGIVAQTSAGREEIRADLIVAADGRHSTIRAAAALPVRTLGAPIDVLWMRISRRLSDPAQTLGAATGGKFMAMLNRGDYWQCAYLIPKAGLESIRAAGIDAFRASIAALAPFLEDRTSELGWDDIRLLTVRVDRLKRWFEPGLLCIGDAAHAMSPAGGVGVNLAIQDAVAAANILCRPLRSRHVTTRDLARVQRRRMFPTRVTQAAQVQIQNRFLAPAMRGRSRLLDAVLVVVRRAPFIGKLAPFVRWFVAQAIGVGIRPEHVRTPDTAVP